ncbi:hypothetical protein [Parasitella parasitica]|uniref:Uncharacterized protein n=1 Tax=Parasitella parasitica TaxID=35722 RepID=A0A0B7NDH1_9FUNG|nr:hypothetical protein [Parasitella parasitica]
MFSKVSSQTIFSNLCPQDINSTEFSHFMGSDRFVEVASVYFDLHKNSGLLISFLGLNNAILKVKDAATISTKDEASICESLEVSITTDKEKAFLRRNSRHLLLTTTAKSSRRKLVNVHDKSLSQLFHNDEFAILASAKMELERKFSGLVVFTSCIHQNLRENCVLVVKSPFDAGSVVQLARSMMFDEVILVGMTFLTMNIRESFEWPKDRSDTGQPPSARFSGIRDPLMIALTSQQILSLPVVSPVSVAKEGATEREKHYKVFSKFLKEMVGTLEKRKNRTFVVEEEWPVSNRRVQDLVKSKGYRWVH